MLLYKKQQTKQKQHESSKSDQYGILKSYDCYSKFD